VVPLNKEGFLPIGIHDFSLDDIGSLFGRFQRTESRLTLFRKLVELVDEMKDFPFVRWVIVDESFVTEKDEPSDIDLVIVVDGSIFTREGLLNPFEYNAVSSRRLRKRYSFDVFVVPEGSAAYDQYVTHFSRVKEGNSDSRKGMVRLRLQ